MRKGFAIAIMAISCLDAHAQRDTSSFFELSGKVIDTAGIALVKATIQLIAGSDTLTTLSQDDGGFLFRNVPSRKIKLLITMRGYLPFSEFYPAPVRKSVVDLPSIPLRVDYNELDPVIVTRLRPITIQGDTVNYNAAAFPVRDGSEVQDILKRLPGIEVDINGNVTIQGKPLTKVLVNGKEFFGSDLLLAIQNLPAEIVSKIQVIDDYGDKARLTGIRSGDATKVLNIVLKADRRNGEFGRAEAGKGSQNKYIGEGFGNAFKVDRQLSAMVGIGNNSPMGSDLTSKCNLSYTDRWNSRWSGAININSATQAPHSTDSSSQKTYYPGETLEQQQNSQNISRTGQTGLDTRLTYKPTNNSTLRLTAIGALTQADNNGSALFNALQQDSGFSKSSSGKSIANIHSASQMLQSAFYYEKISVNSRQRYSIEGGWGFNSLKTLNIIINSANILEGGISTPSYLNDQITNTSTNSNVHLESRLFLPIGQTSFFELGSRIQSNNSIKNAVVQTKDSGTNAFETIDSLSQRMLLRTLTQDLHAAYSAKFDHVEITAGLDVQATVLKGSVEGKANVTSYSYFSILPDLEAAWNLAKSCRLILNYFGQPTFPSLQQLTPYTDLSNPQYPVTGNPSLKPSYNNYFGLHFEQSSLRPTQFFGFRIGVTYSNTNNTITQNLTSPLDSSQIIQAATYVNAGTTNNISTDYLLTLPAIIDHRVRITINGSFGNVQTITMTNSIQYFTRNSSWNQSVHLQWQVPDLIEIDLTGKYTVSNTLYSVAATPRNTFRAADISLSGSHYLFTKWILDYQLSQAFTNSGARLQPAPTNLAASLQRQFLKHNKGTLTLAGYNLFNQLSGSGQTVSPTTILYNKPMLTGRYFMILFQLKLQHFRK